MGQSLRVLSYRYLTTLLSSLALLLLSHVSHSFADTPLRKLDEYHYKSFSLSVSEDKRNNIVLKVTDPTLKDSSYFTIPDPTRFVLDILGSDHAVNKVFTVNHPYLKKVRMGSHPGKNRVVLDMSGTKAPHVSVQNDSGSSKTLIFLISADAQLTKTSTFIPLDSPTESSSPQHTPSPINENSGVTKEMTDLRKELPTSTPTPPPSEASELIATRRVTAPSPQQTPPPRVEEPSPSPSKPTHVEEAQTTIVLKASPKPKPSIPEGRALIKIVFNENTPAQVQFLLSKKARFTFVKKSLKEYQLTLHGCGAVEEHLLLPYFPPHTFPGVNFVQAKKQGDSLVVSLQTDHGTRLSPRLNGESVIVEISQTGSL